MNENFSGSLIYDPSIRELLESAPIGILIFDEYGKVEFTNKNFYSLSFLHEYELNESISENIEDSEFISSFNLNKEIDGIKHFRSFQKEISHLRGLDGNKIRLIVKGSPIFSGEKFRGGIVILEDMRFASPKEPVNVNIDENFLSQILDNVSAYFVVLDQNKKIKVQSTKQNILFERNVGEIISSVSFERLYQNFKSSREKTIADLPVEMDEQIFLIRTTILPLNRNNFSSEEIVVLFDDLTKELNEKIRSEGELNELRRFKIITQAVGGAVVTINGDNKITFWNRKAKEIFGYDKSQVFGKYINRVITEWNEDYLKELRDELLIENHIERQISFRSGQKYLYLKSGKIDDGSVAFLFFDLTGLFLNSSKIILESEERYKNIIENLQEVLWTAENINGKPRAFYYTASTEKITGFPRKQFIDDPKLWYKIIYPDDLHRVINELKNLYRNPVNDYGALEYRILHKQGSIIWIRNKITVVRNKQGGIEKIFGLVNDISESKKNEERLKKYGEELKELNKAKDRFISIVSHDLRSPFNSILGFTDLLLNEPDVTEEEKTQYVKYIRESSFNLLSLVNSLLDWTRLQTGRIEFEPERLDARLIITRAIHMLSGAAMKKDIDLRSEVDSSLYIKADENLMLQAFNNLVSNAIKFTKPGGRILISATFPEQKNVVQFSVKDDGVGIEKNNIAKLFKVDTKFTLAGTAGEKGSGLGLSLVQEIIQKHGGKIWVESEVGRGSDFKFTIPIAPANILLVDDATSDRILYSKLIKTLLPDYNILKAETVKEALKIVLSSTPALVISDHRMPEMTGYDLIKKIKDAEIENEPPFIILSNYINEEISERYKEAGVEYVFRKPVNLSKFKFALESSLKKSFVNGVHSQE